MKYLFIFFFIVSIAWASAPLPEAIKNFGTNSKNQKALNPNSIKLLLWNVHKAEDGEIWAHDFQKISEAHDLLALQEVFLNPLMLKLFQDSKDFSYFMGVSFFYKKIGDTGVANASKVSPLEVRAYRSPLVESLYGTPKMSAFTIYALEGRSEKLLLLNTHALNFDLGSKFQKHLEDLVPLIKNHDGPVIWAGDFNTWSDHRLKIFEKVMNDLGLTAVTFSDDLRATFMWNHVVDHIYFKGLKTVKAQVLSEIKSSDHKPVSVEFALEKKSGV